MQEGGLDDNHEAWSAEYARLTKYLEQAYCGDGDGIRHPASEMYDDRESVGALMEHYDHDAELRKHAKRKARREAQRVAQSMADATVDVAVDAAGPARQEKEGDYCRHGARSRGTSRNFYAGGSHAGTTPMDAPTAERHSHVLRAARSIAHPSRRRPPFPSLAPSCSRGRSRSRNRMPTLTCTRALTRTLRSLGHPFATLRASTGVAVWWPVRKPKPEPEPKPVQDMRSSAR